MKLKNVQAYPIKNVPDHITHECSELGRTIVDKLEPLFKGRSPNIVLGAITFFHAAIIKSLISDEIDEQKKASQLVAIGLINCVNFLNGIENE